MKYDLVSYSESGKVTKVSDVEITKRTLMIYALVDISTECIRYIGLSSNGYSRPLIHLNKNYYSRKDNKGRYVYCWIRKNVAIGKTPRIVVLEIVYDRKLLSDAEKKHIKKCQDLKAKLCNLTSGGESGFKFSKKHKDSIQKAIRNKKKVVRLDTNEVFESAVAAARAIGCHKEAMYACLRHKENRDTVYGVKFRYINDLNYIKQEIDKPFKLCGCGDKISIKNKSGMCDRCREKKWYIDNKKTQNKKTSDYYYKNREDVLKKQKEYYRRTRKVSNART